MAQKGALLAGRPRVFVTQETPFNFTPAQEFGDIEFLTHEDVVNIKDSGHNRELIRQIWRKLRRFDTERDWMLVAGSPYVAAIAFMLLGRAGSRKVHLLRWSNRDQCYTPVYLDLTDVFLNPL